jgi:hypothetical protein
MLRESPLGLVSTCNAFFLDPALDPPAQQHGSGSVRMTRWIATAGAAVVATLAFSGAASAQDAPDAHTPPSWDTLVKCAQMADEDARLACYDTSMKAAGYAPNPTAVSAEKHKKFGLGVPQIGLLKKHGKEQGAAAGASAAPSGDAANGQAAPAPAEKENEITVELAQVATLRPDNRLLLITTDGQIWEQVGNDQTIVPKTGDTVRIRRNPFGGYFCDVTKYVAVRCKRDR